MQFLLLAVSLLVLGVDDSEAKEWKPVRLPIPEGYQFAADDWYGIYMGEQKLGYAHFGGKVVTDNGRQAFESSNLARCKVVFDGEEIGFEKSEFLRFSSEPPYELISARTLEVQGPYKREISVKRAGEGYEATISEADSSRTLALKDLDYNFLDQMTLDFWLQKDRKVGDRLVVRSFSLDDLKASMDVHTIVGVGETLAGGVPMTYYDIEILDPEDGTKLNVRMDDEKMLVGSFGEVFEARLEPAAVAKDLRATIDVTGKDQFRLDKPLGDASEVQRLVLEVVGENAQYLPSSGRQKLVKDKAGRFILTIGEGELPVATPEETAKALEETVEHPIRDPELVALAQRIVRDAATEQAKVAALVRFVDEYIEDDYAAEPLTVQDILRVRRGDCTEHSLLFATLARAVGIPTRETSGLVYAGDEERRFAAHAWNECVIAGRWVPIDATWGEVDINATHISFSGMNEAESLRYSLGRDVSFKLLKVKKKPKAEAQVQDEGKGQ